MMSTRALLAGMVLLGATAAWADRLTLKTGTVVNGTYLGGSSRQVRMEVDGQIQSYEVEQVRSIAFGDDQPLSRTTRPASQPTPPPPSQQQPALSPRASEPNYSQEAVSGVTIPADTVIEIRMVDSVNSETARLGQTFQASLDEPIYVNGQQVVPRGADVLTKLVNDQRAGKIQGRNVLTLALSQISVNGRYIDVTSTDVQTSAGSQTARTAKVVGGTSALGAIVGAIAGGGTGAAIGAASGAAVGGAATVLTNGPQVKIPSETRLTFRLQAPARL